MQHQEPVASKTPSVVPRSDIPISSAPEDGGLEVRPFQAHELLSNALPPLSTTLAWTRAEEGQEVSLRSHPTPGLLIVLEGSAELVGQLRRKVTQGDVVTLPSHHEYGFTAVGPQGLNALHVAFREERAARPGQAETLAELLAKNEVRAAAASKNAYFQLLHNGMLDSRRGRARYLDCVRVFSNAFQTYMLTRQAMCQDGPFAREFEAHLVEELGHNKLLKGWEDAREFFDPILEATLNWFCHQMLVLDNAGKAVVNLALETGGYHFHTAASPVFQNDEQFSEYFGAHAEGDEEHKEIGIALLEGQNAESYRRLSRILDEAWDMLEAVMARIVRLVELEQASS